jgi:hypothetical protein
VSLPARERRANRRTDWAKEFAAIRTAELTCPLMDEIEELFGAVTKASVNA